MNKRKVKIAILAAVLSLVVSSIILIGGASAENVRVTAGRIKEANIAFNDKLTLAFTVEPTILLPNNAELGLGVWESTEEDPTLSNISYVNFRKKTLNGYNYYKTKEISLSDVSKEIYVAAVYKLDGAISLAQNPVKYSMATFFMKNLANPIGGNRATVYENYVALAEKAGAKFTTYVEAVGGYVGYSDSTRGGVLGQNVLLRAPAKNSEGEYFIAWVDSNGTTVSNSRVTTVIPSFAGVHTYTATYGERENSLYKSTYDLEALDTGKIDFYFPGEDAADKVVSGYDSAKTPLFSSSKSIADKGISMQTYMMLKKVGDGLYYYDKAHEFEVVDTEIAGKALEMRSGHSGKRGGYVTFTDLNESYAIGAEADITYDTAKSGGYFYMGLVLTDKYGKSVTLRTNLSSGATTLSCYAEGDGSDYPGVYCERKITRIAGDTLTFRIDLNRENESVVIYENGTLLEELPLTSYATYKKALDAAEKKNEENKQNAADGETPEEVIAFDVESLHITKITIAGISNTSEDITIDNLTFFCGEPIEMVKPEEGAEN